MAVYKFSNVSGFKNYQRYNDFLAGNPAVILDAGAYFPLGEFTLASAQASVSFTNIPQTYTHLQIRSIQRAVDNLSGDWPYMRFNNISTNTYSWHRLSGSGAAASAGAGSTTNLIRYAFATADGGYTSGNFSGVVIDILDYKNTNKYKTVRVLSGADNNGSGNAYVNLESGLFQSTNAIDRIDLFPYSGNWAINSQFALYGVLA